VVYQGNFTWQCCKGPISTLNYRKESPSLSCVCEGDLMSKGSLPKEAQITLRIHADLMKLHIRAIGCHCETMGMMSENMISACEGGSLYIKT
jgi:hypothetical protein